SGRGGRSSGRRGRRRSWGAPAVLDRSVHSYLERPQSSVKVYLERTVQNAATPPGALTWASLPLGATRQFIGLGSLRTSRRRRRPRRVSSANGWRLQSRD